MKKWLDEYEDNRIDAINTKRKNFVEKTSINEQDLINQDLLRRDPVPDIINPSLHLYKPIKEIKPVYSHGPLTKVLKKLVGGPHLDALSGLVEIGLEENQIKQSDNPEFTREEFEKQKRNFLGVDRKKDLFPNPYTIYKDGGEINYNDSNVTIPPNFAGMSNDTSGRNYSPSWNGQFQIGGVIPSSFNSDTIRRGDIPSNSKYAKKTKASAENGKEMQYYQQGMDFNPKSISRNGIELDQLTNFNNRGENKKWLNQYYK